MPRMSDAPNAASRHLLAADALHASVARALDEKMVCERCGGANVYRMHAVWRCADCGFKTDCCGW